MHGTWARFTSASSCFWAYLSWEGRALLFTNGITSTGTKSCQTHFAVFVFSYVTVFSKVRKLVSSNVDQQLGFKVLSIMVTKATECHQVTSSLGQTSPIILWMSAVVIIIDSSLKSQTLVDVLTSQLAYLGKPFLFKRFSISISYCFCYCMKRT